jgi:hypothetical protein
MSWIVIGAAALVLCSLTASGTLLVLAETQRESLESLDDSDGF